MEPVNKRNLWLSFCISFVTTLLVCVAFYFLAVLAGATKQLAALWAAVSFVIFVVALGLGFRRVTLNPGSNPLTIFPSLGNRFIFWMATGIVVPVLAFVLHLGTSFLVVALLTIIQTAGYSIAKLIEPISWIASGISLLCASGVWWVIWKQYKDSFERDKSMDKS